MGEWLVLYSVLQSMFFLVQHLIWKRERENPRNAAGEGAAGWAGLAGCVVRRVNRCMWLGVHTLNAAAPVTATVRSAPGQSVAMSGLLANLPAHSAPVRPNHTLPRAHPGLRVFHRAKLSLWSLKRVTSHVDPPSIMMAEWGGADYRYPAEANPATQISTPPRQSSAELFFAASPSRNQTSRCYVECMWNC